jgi:hypothetical protein
MSTGTAAFEMYEELAMDRDEKLSHLLKFLACIFQTDLAQLSSVSAIKKDHSQRYW